MSTPTVDGAVDPQLWEPGSEEGLRATLRSKPLCVSCTGRLFARVGKGLTNRERGERALALMRVEAADSCWLCRGLVEEIPKFAGLIIDELSKWESDTFLVGCKLDPDLMEREEVLWAEAGVQTYEPIKAEINREAGKIVEARLGRTVEFKRPQVTAIINTMLDHVEIQASPLYIYGRYRKLVRGIPQTRWPCRRCRGTGCEKCDFTGKMYETSVEEVIADRVMGDTRGEEHSFHGMGREDIDALMLGRGRPFIFEVHRPRRRNLDLASIAKRVGMSGVVEVEELRPSNRAEVISLKDMTCEKSYRIMIRLEGERPLQKLNEAVEALKTSKIVQRTPTRVAHRRADKERVRKVVKAEVHALNERTAEIQIRTEAGTYVKELVHGDNGRTRPSLAELLETEADVLELDVLEIHDEDRHGESLQGHASEDKAKVQEEAEG